VSQAPVGDAVAQAQATESAARSALAFMRAHAHAFDPNQIRAMQAEVNNDEKATVQTIADRAMQVIQANEATAQAADIGNVVAQAQDAVNAANQQTAAAKTPEQRSAATQARAQAAIGAYQAGQQRIQNQGAYAAALASGDSVAVAQADINMYTALLASAKGYDDKLAAEAGLKSAEFARSQAMESRIQALGQVAETAATGDLVSQAAISQGTAAKMMAAAHGTDEVIAAEQAQAAANVQMRQAQEQRATEMGALAASTTADPVKQLDDQIKGAMNALAHASGVDETAQLQTQLNNLKLQRANTVAQQGMSLVQFEFDMMEISSGQAIEALDKLLNGKLSPEMRQSIEELIRRFKLGLETPIGGGTMNIAPGNIRLPTFYDVAHAIQHGRLSGPTHNHTANIDASQDLTITVNVNKGQDANLVYDAIDKATSANLRQRLRAAGVR
jgi:hypothetical protein